MTTNVVPLFGNKKEKKEQPPVDVTGLILTIANWAESHGINIYQDTAFDIRVSDLMAHLKVMAMESRKSA